MATTARSPPAARRPLSASPTTASSPIARGATARAAVSPRVSSPLNKSNPRRASLKGASSPLLNGSANGSHDNLAESLKLETEQKEQLLVQLQEKDQTISNLTSETINLTSSLNGAQTRLNEFYEEQSRTETEMANRIEISEKLRSQIRELEKEKRDIQRRYNEQTATFDAERQALYDNEQHLKSRIQSLTSARKEELSAAREPSDIESILEPEVESPQQPSPAQPATSAPDEESEPAIVTALNLELSTLSTSYTSLQSTVSLMQTQLMDLKRVNQELQEDNESYMILLRERTLNGQFDVLKHVGGTNDDEREDDNGDVGSLRSNATDHRSALDRVDEEDVGPMPGNLGQELSRSPELEMDTQREREDPIPRQPSRNGRKRGQSNSQPGTPHGESLADLPITGPGLDLAAELGRAQNRDILDGKLPSPEETFGKRSTASGGKRGTDPRTLAEVEQLKTEVKSLKDANKALSLYASKIIDRIISEEGFEHVLAVDYEQPPPTPISKQAPTGFGAQAKVSEQQSQEKTAKKPRPQSAIMARSISTPDYAAGGTTAPAYSPPQLTTFASLPPAPASTTAKANRRSMSFDWKSFSIFNKDTSSPTASPHLRPLTLGKPGSGSVVGARKLEKSAHEDDEDRKERERLNATMKLMGIEPSPSPAIPPADLQTNFAQRAPSQATPTITRRFSLFGTRSPPVLQSPSPPIHGSPESGVGLGIGGLTQDALVQAEAVNVIAAQDTRERNLSAELAKGGTGGTQFTEITRRKSGRRSSQRSGRSGGGSESGRSGSTVFSAGIQEED